MPSHWSRLFEVYVSTREIGRLPHRRRCSDVFGGLGFQASRDQCVLEIPFRVRKKVSVTLGVYIAVLASDTTVRHHGTSSLVRTIDGFSSGIQMLQRWRPVRKPIEELAGKR